MQGVYLKFSDTKMEIMFVRHAEKEILGENSDLTSKGIRQAKYLGKRLKREKIGEVYCSELNRARQTAEIITKEMSIKPRIESSLNEFESETIKKAKKKWIKEEKSQYKELISFLKKLTKNPNEEKLILIIAHGNTNRLILSHFLDLSHRKLLRFTQKEACLNHIFWKDEFKNWSLRSWNNADHLPENL